MTTNRRPSLCAARRPARLLLALCAAALGAACAGARAPEATRPRANEPQYPIVLVASAERREQALSAWQALAPQPDAPTGPTPELQPVTATLAALPAAVQLHLPHVELTQSSTNSGDEGTREALRRFLTNAAPLLGVSPKDLSLVADDDAGDGTRRARYRQKPFPYPLRSGYGRIDIRYTPDGQVRALASTALPDTERLGRALAAVRPAITAEVAQTGLAGRTVSYPTDTGTQSYTVAAGDSSDARQLVVYPLSQTGPPATLALHLAWEVLVARPGQTQPLVVYVDAVSGDVLAAEPQPARPDATE